MDFIDVLIEGNSMQVVAGVIYLVLTTIAVLLCWRVMRTSLNKKGKGVLEVQCSDCGLQVVEHESRIKSGLVCPLCENVFNANEYGNESREGVNYGSAEKETGE